ncbi:MAG: carbohydrate ABC transporter permease [Fibrobacteres bacterium]|nr:carbohydrate ABC transporter permease [Fibrobacterota bacterium]
MGNKIFRFTVLVSGVIVMCIPFWWMLVTAFDETANSTVRIPPSLWFHEGHTGLLNFKNTLGTIPILRYYFNSIFITVSVVAVQLLSCSMAGYAFAKGHFPGKNKIFLIVLATMMVPFQLYMIPLYLLMNKAGLVNTPLAIILPSLQSAYGIFLMTQYMKSLPEAILESARIEGAGEFRIFFTIILPLSKPALATLAVLTTLSCWNDFLWPYLVLFKESQYTITVGVSMFQQQGVVAVGNVVVVSLLAIAPVIVLYLFLQRYIISGITMGATKH